MPWKDKSKYRTEAYREYVRDYQRSWHQRNRAQRIAKEHYEWARRSKKPAEEGVAAQFQRVEQALSVSQEEEFAHAAENQYVPVEVDINVCDDSADRL
jgi:hypothetical protein